EREGGQHERGEPVAARRGQPAELDREDEDEEETQPVHGHGLAEEHAHRADGVDERVAAEGGQDARGHRHHEGETEAGRGQLERGGQGLEDQGEGGHLMLERHAKITTHRAREEADVLDPERIVEPEEGAELADILLTRLEGQEETRGVSREVKKAEDDDRHAEKDKGALPEPAEEVGEHSLRRPSPLPSPQRGEGGLRSRSPKWGTGRGG